ncbi:hypothetical protein PCE1_003089 [Barthelona sp. PCE]
MNTNGLCSYCDKPIAKYRYSSKSRVLKPLTTEQVCAQDTYLDDRYQSTQVNDCAFVREHVEELLSRPFKPLLDPARDVKRLHFTSSANMGKGLHKDGKLRVLKHRDVNYNSFSLSTHIENRAIPFVTGIQRRKYNKHRDYSLRRQEYKPLKSLK